MSFNFGNTSVPTLGTSTPAKPFGFAFGSPAATSAPPAFGSNTSTFGQPATNTSFGQPAATPAFGQQPAATSFAFGQPSTATTQPPAFGFNSTATTSAPSFGFGSTLTSSAAPAFSGFGTAATNTTQSSAFPFGSTTSSAAPAFGGFGGTSTATTQAPSFGFGTSSAPSLFNNTGLSTGFGGFGTSGAAPAFGQQQPQQQSAFSGFGQNQQQQQQQQQQQPLSQEEIFSQAIFNVSLFGDERDIVVARWNYLQALFGTGKAVYSQSQPPVDITAQNSLCRFKAMGYSRIPGKDNKLGFVAIKFNKPLSQIKDLESQLITKLSQLFGNKPNLIIHIDSMRSLSDNASQVVFYIDDKQPNSNETKRITATDTSNFLNQQSLKFQLTPMGIEEIFPIVTLDDDQLKQYLETPPNGVDSRLWRQAIADNPDAKKFIPVPLICFNDLKTRLTCQETETSNHSNYLAKLEKDISELKLRHTNTASKITEQRRKLAELSHRILRIIVKQESTRKAGLALTPDEEVIKTKLENMHALVSAPTQFKGKLNELLAQMRMQRSQWTALGTNEYTLDKESSDEMKNFLSMHQKAMEMLIETINKDMKDLKTIGEGMSRINSGVN